MLDLPFRSLLSGFMSVLVLSGLASASQIAKADDSAKHWAFQPVIRPELPAVTEKNWSRNPIDRFILASLEATDLRHSPEADRVSLIRRVTYDLTGLPPSREDVDRFVSDPRPDAYEQVVDRLLASSQFGERQAQHWLDLAHHGDSNGFELDAERHDAWRYRDWVVKAFNDDMPYDRFVKLQLAGDEFEPGDPSALIATGFGRAGPREVVGGNVDPLVKRQSELTEVTGTVGSVLLGLTIGCARCHDHKSDPIPTTDYYSLQSFFAASELVEIPISTTSEVEEYNHAKSSVETKIAPLKKRKAEIEAPYRNALKAQREAKLTTSERELLAIPVDQRTPSQKRLVEGLSSSLMIRWEDVAEAVAKDPGPHAEREQIKREIETIEQTLPRPPAQAQALIDQKTTAPETHVLRRGDVKSLGPKVEPKPPSILLASQPARAFEPEAIQPTKTTTGRRRVLAEWITRTDNPLTSRVIVNRLWQNHFGRGIVATSSDFGIRGESPTQPELLDWLASELVERGWSLKAIHRLMVTSAAYRQVSTTSTELARKQAGDDPENHYLWRMNRRRLDAEGIRDAMLAVSGELNLKAGGPGVLVPIEPEVEALIFTEAEVVDLWPVTPDPREHARRSLYLFRKRNVRYPLLDVFDAPDTQTPCPRRMVSTHALQALVLLNSDFAGGRAKALAGRLFAEAPNDETQRLQLAYKIVLGRAARPAELAQARAFLGFQAELLAKQAKAGTPPALPTSLSVPVPAALGAAWVDFARAMLNLNEFLYVP